MLGVGWLILVYNFTTHFTKSRGLALDVGGGGEPNTFFLIFIDNTPSNKDEERRRTTRDKATLSRFICQVRNLDVLIFRNKCISQGMEHENQKDRL